jgi:hypothetical protein
MILVTMASYQEPSGIPDAAVAFCSKCGEPCPDELPKPGKQWECPVCKKGRQLTPDRGDKRFRYLSNCLRSTNPKVVGMSQAAFVQWGKTGETRLLELLEEEPGEIRRIAPVLGRIGGESSVDALIDHLRKEHKRIGWQRWVWRWVGLAIVIAAFWMFKWAGFCVMFFVGGWLSVDLAFPVRRTVANALREIGDPASCGVLAVAHRQRELRKSTTPALLSLLPKLRMEHAGIFHSRERRALLNLIQSNDAELAVRAIRAHGFIGNDSTLHLFRLLVKEGPTRAEVHDSIKETIPILERTLQMRKEMPTLLRAATAIDEEAQTLLRPAGQGEVEERLLLRPVQSDDESTQNTQEQPNEA